MPKRYHPKKHYLRTLTAWGCGIFLAVVTGYTIGAVQFNETHFNPNVTIDGVDVGRLTVKQAYTKVNANANNIAVLHDHRVRDLPYQNGHTVGMQTIKQDFAKQQTWVESTGTWSFATRSLTISHDKLARLNKQRVTMDVLGHRYSFTPNDAFRAVHWYNGKYHFADPDPLVSKVDQINNRYATLNKNTSLTTPDGQNITVKNATYGWQLDADKVQAALIDAFVHHQKTIDVNKCLKGTGYNQLGTGYTNVNHGLGSNYVLVSIKQQKAWIIKDNQPAVTLNDVVTGTADASKNDATPTGVYYIMYKQSPSVLRGKNDDGTNYASKVSYWEPFTQSGCGLHDASWRKDWSKTAYQEGGSHGCVNIKPEEMPNVWNITYQNEPVIVYND